MKSLYDIQKENINHQVEVLSYLLNDSTVYFKCFDVLRADMFTGENKTIYDAFVSIINDGKKPDLANISEKAKIPMETVIKIMTFYSGSPIPIESLLHALFDFMAKEKLVKLAGFVSTQVNAGTDYELIIDQVNKTVGELELGTTTTTIGMDTAIADLLHIINNNRKTDQPFTGTPTGFKIIDGHMRGFHPGDLIVLAGETSHGKTTFALNCMYGTSVNYNMPTGIISHEMTPEQLTGRLSSISTAISSKHLLFGKLTDEELYDFNQKIGRLMRANIWIQGFIKRELTDTIAAIRLMVMQHQVKYIIVENAGNINVKGKNDDESRTAEISKSMKAIAMELSITVILISHLSRERDGKKVQPSLNRLRHSGQLENDADVVMFIYRPELHGFDMFCDNSDQPGLKAEGMAKIIIAKGRNVGLAQSYMKFNETLTLITDDTGTGYPF